MSRMFSDAEVFNGNIGSWDVSSVEDMSNMFGEAVRFNQDISAWDVSSVTSMAGMFTGASSFNQNLCPWGQLVDSANVSFANEDYGEIFAGTRCGDPTNPLSNGGNSWCQPCQTI